MKITAHCKNTNEMEIEMTFTTTLYYWQQILKNLEQAPFYSPTDDIKLAIRNVINNMSETFEGSASLAE